MEFVTAAANLRAHSFGIPLQSLFDAKGIAGNIIHAIATTNAIIAGLIVLEAIKLLKNDFDQCRQGYICNGRDGCFLSVICVTYVKLARDNSLVALVSLPRCF